MRNRLTGLRVCISIAAALFATFLFAQGTQSAWKQYSYPSDGFAFSAPTKPTFSQQPKQTDMGQVEMHTYSIVLGDSGMVLISSTEIKGIENSPKERLQDAKLGALAAGKAKLTSEHAIALGGYPGLQYVAETEKVHVRARMYIVRNRLLQLVEVSPLAIAIPADAERICNSLKLVGPAAQ